MSIIMIFVKLYFYPIPLVCVVVYSNVEQPGFHALLSKTFKIAIFPIFLPDEIFKSFFCSV